MNFWLKWGGNVKRIKSQLVYNLKKDKGSYISFGIVVLITAIMLNLALVLVFQVDRAYDNKFEDLETATINVCIPQIQDTDTLREDEIDIDGICTQLDVNQWGAKALIHVTDINKYTFVNKGRKSKIYCLQDGVISEEIFDANGENIISISGIKSELIISVTI